MPSREPTGEAMKRRSKAGGGSAKTRRRKIVTPKRRNAPKAQHSSSVPPHETEIARLTRERDEALEQQTATSEVLKVISSSPGELAQVFAKILESAVRICDASFGNIHRWNGDALMIIATHNTPTAFAEIRKNAPLLRPGVKNPLGRVIKTKALVHVHDSAKLEAYAEGDPPTVAAVELGGVRTTLAVPM